MHQAVCDEQITSGPVFVCATDDQSACGTVENHAVPVGGSDVCASSSALKVVRLHVFLCVGVCVCVMMKLVAWVESTGLQQLQ